MTKVTYLFGAGASALTMPIVSTIPKDLKEFIAYLGRFRETQHVSALNREILSEMLSEYNWLLAQSAKHSSIDTFAKKLFITKDHEQLKKFKLLISLFFAHLQSSREVDLRYDSFFASVINDNAFELPKNIKIISWNYDHQFEIAYKSFREPSTEVRELQAALNISIKETIHSEKQRFSIFKINGDASFYDATYTIHNLFGESVVGNNIFNTYRDLKNSNVKCALSFAWEPEQVSLINKMIPFIAPTTILVVIGYSFPFFNRKVDRDIIKKMIHLKKVYFQSLEAPVIKERFLAIRDDIHDKDLVLRNDTNQFLIPDELEF